MKVTTLQDVKVGDYFMRYRNLGFERNACFKAVKCERVTNKQAIIGGLKYRKEDAVVIGGDWADTLHIIDKNEMEKSKIKIIRYYINNTEWKKLSDDQILRIDAIIKESNILENCNDPA